VPRIDPYTRFEPPSRRIVVWGIGARRAPLVGGERSTLAHAVVQVGACETCAALSLSNRGRLAERLTLKKRYLMQALESLAPRVARVRKRDEATATVLVVASGEGPRNPTRLQ
jgi:hypothetical protein